MKTPKEIKKGLECCADLQGYDADCLNCPYNGEQWCGDKSKTDALAYIQQLEAELAAVKLDFEAYRTRNINQTSGVFACDMCKHGGDYYAIDFENKKCPEGCDGLNKWEWRGVCAENGGNA